MVLRTANGEERYFPAAAKEMMLENNYNMIDGIINNKPSNSPEEKQKEAVAAKKENVKERENKISEHANRTSASGTRRRRSVER